MKNSNDLTDINKNKIYGGTAMNTSAVLWYKSSAIDFNSALPVGNGRIGGMVYGRVGEELINLNEESIWSGGKRHRINPDAKIGRASCRERV